MASKIQNKMTSTSQACFSIVFWMPQSASRQRGWQILYRVHNNKLPDISVFDWNRCTVSFNLPAQTLRLKHVLFGLCCRQYGQPSGLWWLSGTVLLSSSIRQVSLVFVDTVCIVEPTLQRPPPYNDHLFVATTFFGPGGLSMHSLSL